MHAALSLKTKSFHLINMKILIADDGLTIRRLLETYLTQWGYDVVIASDGNKAWELLKQPDTPRLVILDWLMPGMDGIEVCRRVRKLEHGKLLHIIIFTSLDSQKNIITALDAGADDFIAKKFDMDEFRARIKVGERSANLKSELAGKVRDLEKAISDVKRLQGILPICMHCGRVRDEREVWQKLEEYVMENSEAELSHGLCPACLKKHYPEFSDDLTIRRTSSTMYNGKLISL